MVIWQRLAFSFLAILVLFGLNLAIHFWSDQKRDNAFGDLLQAISRQTLVASIKQSLGDLQKEVALLSQVMVESREDAAGQSEIARFNDQLEATGDQIRELRALSVPGNHLSGELERTYSELSASWSTFYENLGLDHPKAITVLAVRADPLSQRVLYELVPQIEMEEKDQVEVANTHFYEVARLTKRMTIFIFAISTLVAITLAFLVSRYLVRGLAELKRGTALIGSGNLDHRIAMPAHDELGSLAQAFNDMADKLRHCYTQLTQVNKELETFSYSVSHDLRAPLRSIDGFSLALLEDYSDKLDAEGKNYLGRVRAACQRMAQLIDDMLNLSRVTRNEMNRETVHLSALAQTISTDLQKSCPERQVKFIITEELFADGDASLLRAVLENLLGNAWKFTGRKACGRIEFGVTQQNGEPVYFVRDDGDGFDPAYADKLFGVFQRLHAMDEFEGTGIGLATVQRIIHRHGGQVWAEGAVGKGATFYFTL